jgi:hypothetical protein
MDSVQQSFTSCASANGVDLQALQAGPGGPPPPFPMGGPGGQFDLEQVKMAFEQAKREALRMCNNNTQAVKALAGCVIDVATKGDYVPVALTMINPEFAMCKVGKQCNESNPVSGECKAKFINMRDALCKCKTDSEKVFNEGDQCKVIRDKMQAMQPDRPPMPPPIFPPNMDICDQHESPQVHCEELAKLQTMIPEFLKKFQEKLAAPSA